MTQIKKHRPGFEQLVAEVPPFVKEVTPEDVLKRQETGKIFHLFDVREDHEWIEGRAKGAKHLGRGIIERDIEKLVPDFDDEIILYCGGGYRSALAAFNLQKMGSKKY